MRNTIPAIPVCPMDDYGDITQFGPQTPEEAHELEDSRWRRLYRKDPTLEPSRDDEDEDDKDSNISY